MTCDGWHHRIQPWLLRRVLRPKVRENRSVNRMLASSLAGSEHLLEAVRVLAEVMQQPGKMRKSRQGIIERAGT